MPDDRDAIWKLLADRSARDADLRREDRTNPDVVSGRRLRRESTVRILSATINVVGAVRELLEVTEGALTEHRDHLARQTEAEPETARSAQPESRKRKIDLDY